MAGKTVSIVPFPTGVEESEMYTVIKKKGNRVRAYQLGIKSADLDTMIAEGRIRDLGNGTYEVKTLETQDAGQGGEIARAGDWIKVDGNGWPYPNGKEFFEKNHRHIEGDTFEQIPKPLKAWDAGCEMCPEVMFLKETKGLRIDESSIDCRYSAKLWGTLERANRDAVIVFYSIEYDSAGIVKNADFNFVARDEFTRTYSVIS